MPRGQSAGPVGVEIENLSKFLRDLRKFEPKVNKAFRDRLRKVVKVVATDARQRAPKKSGRLAKGIVPSITGKGARLMSKAKHAKVHEFGGRHRVYGRDTWVFQPARPHVLPAAEDGRPLINREALEALDDAISQIGFH